MDAEQWSYHRQRAIEISPLGLVSRMKDGKIKMEGYAPMYLEQAKNHVRTKLAVLRRQGGVFDEHLILTKLEAIQ